MLSTSKTNYDSTCVINVNFGDVPVGSVHKKSISITNNLKKTTKFQVKNDNESMYMADSINFEPLKTPRIFPKKNTSFLIIFSPKSVHVRATLEYFTIFSINDQTEMLYDVSDEIVQKVTICVRGSCYGPSVTIFPAKIFLYQQMEKNQQSTIKSVNLVNSSKMLAYYQVNYDWSNCPIICQPPFGVIKNRVQIKLKLKPRQTGNYYKRLYILITNHHPVYIDVYALSNAEVTLNPISYFKTPFKLPKHENNYVDFFKDVAHPSLPKQHVVISPKELHFGYSKNSKTLSFDVYNNSNTRLYIHWIHGIIIAVTDKKTSGGNNSFMINPKQFDICSRETKTFKCTFCPKTISNIYFAEFEATIHFDPNQLPLPSNYNTTFKILPKCVVPINISFTATGHSFENPFNGWQPKCKLNTNVIIMPPSVPDSKPVFATLFIKKVVSVPTTFEFQSPNGSHFLAKPNCGMINGDYQIVVFQLLRTCNKESIYAEQWNLVFDGFENNSVNIYINACVEFGCVMIGENNYIHVPDNIQVGYEINTQIPIINMTRHRLHYYIHTYDQQPMPEIKSSCSSHSGYERLEEIEETEYGHRSNQFRKDENIIDINVMPKNTSSTTVPSNNSILMSNEPTQSPVNALKIWNSDENPEPNRLPFVFKFNQSTGELGPNEKRHLTLSFCPLKNVLYTVNAKCVLMCNDFPEIVNILPVVVKGNGCKTRFDVTPANCDLSDMIINTERTQRFIIQNRNCSYAKIKFVIKSVMCSSIFWPVPICKINPETFQFTPQKNQCKMDLSIYPTELGFHKFYVNIKTESIVEYDSENENMITIAMNVMTCALQISKITNNSIPYFGKLALNKLFHCMKVNKDLNKVYTKNVSPLTWIIPAISESIIYEFQFYNGLRIPISWALKYNKCVKCTLENNYKKNNCNKKNITRFNKCEHYKSIEISPAETLKMKDFSKIQIKLNNINKDGMKLNYIWSNGVYKSPLYDIELLLEPKTFKDDLISFDPKYGTNGHLEFKFIPIFIANPNPPAQAFWVYNNNSFNIEYSIIDCSLTPAYPYFQCLNPSGIVNAKSIHPLLFIFSPDKLYTFEATVMLLSNNNRHQITLLGQGESYTRTSIWPGPGLSSFLQIKNDTKIFLSTESIILKTMSICSNIKSMCCLYNNSDEEIMYEWKECTIDKILTTIVLPLKGNLKGHENQVFEVTITSYNQPAILTIMLNISYKLVSENENYKQSLRNYDITKNKLDGIFLINECGIYKPKLIKNLENQPQEKHLVLHVYVRIIDEYNSKLTNELKNNLNNHKSQEEKTILKQKLRCSENFRNMMWSIVDEICSKKINYKPLYYYQLRKRGKNIPKKIQKTTKNNLEFVLSKFIKDSLIEIYPPDMWKN